MRHLDSPLAAVLAPTVLALSCAGSPSGPPATQDRTTETLSVVSTILDTDLDGRVSRHEAAAAALLLVFQADGTEAQSASNEQVASAIDAALGAPIRNGLSDDPLTFEIDGSRAIARGVVDTRSPARLLDVLLGERAVDELVLQNVTQVTDPGALALMLHLIEGSGMATRIPTGGEVMLPGIAMLNASKRRYVEPGARILERDVLDEPRPITEAQIAERGLRTEADGLVLVPIGTAVSLRGLSAVSADVAWTTGSNATVARTTDGGASWVNVAPASIDGLDVRDVYALDADIAWIMTVGPAAASRILFTEDGGANWSEQHRESAPEAFLDGFDFWEPGRGLCYGDPMADGRFRLLMTADGETWAPIADAPQALESGEASFAGSGTGIRLLGRQRGWIVTGGTDGTSRVFSTEDAGATWTAAETTLAAPKPGAGAFSVSFTGDGRGVVVGGDYLQREIGGRHVAAWSTDFGKTWHTPEVGPRGQRAGSVAIGSSVFLATGQTGTDITRDGGRTWRPFSSEGFHCVDVSPGDGTIWFAGAEGRVARIR